MAGNKLKEPVAESVEKETEEVVAEAAAPVVRKRSAIRPKRKIVRLMRIFGIFNRNQVADLMPFILFITVLIIGYIANSYYAERMIREINSTKAELKERRAEFISTKSRLMYQSNQSEVAKVLEPFNIKESTEPPHKIFIAETVKK